MHGFKKGVTKKGQENSPIWTADPGNYAVIRIWKPMLRGQHTSSSKVAIHKKGLTDDDSIGHASLMLVNQDREYHYLSLWPDKLVEDPDEDQKREQNREPEEMHVLYTLDHRKLWEITEHNALKDRFPTWSLPGNKKIANPGRKFAPAIGLSYQESHNCSSAVFALLEECGISHLDPGGHYTLKQIICTPNDLGSFLREAVLRQEDKINITISYKSHRSARICSHLLKLTDFELLRHHFTYTKHLLEHTDRQHVLKYMTTLSQPASQPILFAGTQPTFFKPLDINNKYVLLAVAVFVGILVAKLPSLELKDMIIITLAIALISFVIKGQETPNMIINRS